MSSTPEKAAAREAVEKLVNQAREDLVGEHPLVVTEFIVIAAATGWDSDGDEVTAVTIIPDGPEHRMLGLLEHARIRFEAGILESYRGDEDL